MFQDRDERSAPAHAQPDHRPRLRHLQGGQRVRSHAHPHGRRARRAVEVREGSVYPFSRDK